MQRVINLSAIHTLQPIHHGISAFVRLCDKYSNSTFSCCSSFFSHGVNYAWVMNQYRKSLNTLINPYKLGHITTDNFLNGLLEMFPFMLNTSLEISCEDMQRLNDNKASSYSLRNMDNPSACDYAKALLEEAWNSIITFSDEDVAKIQKTFEEEGDVYFMSNTNELNVFKIIQWMQNHLPDKIKLDLNSPQIVQKNMLSVLQIGSGAHLIASYLCHTYKTEQDNTKAQVPRTTPTLLQAIVSNVFSGHVDNLVVISQYPKDLEAATALGINSTHSASDYFHPKSQVEVPLLRG